MICKHCGSENIVKDGYVAGKQRWKCKNCNKTTREGDARRKYKTWQKILAIKLKREGKSMSEIVRLTGAPRSLINYWLRNYLKIIKQEILSIPCPAPHEHFMMLSPEYLGQFQNLFRFQQAFGIIWTDKESIFFIMNS